MNYFTSDTYVLKREIVKFSYLMTRNCRNVDSNLVLDVIYGILASKDVKIMSFTRVLYEDIKYEKTIRRICNRLKEIKDIEVMKENFRKHVVRYLPKDNIIAIFDDSDMVKIYGKKFEDLDEVIDGSDPKKKIKPGYHICVNDTIRMYKKGKIKMYKIVHEIS